MQVTINTKEEPLVVYAISLASWGKGDTIAEALRNMYSAAGGYVKEKNIVDDLEHQRVSLYISNETDGIRIENFAPRPSDGKWVLHLGDEFNGIKVYGNMKGE